MKTQKHGKDFVPYEIRAPITVDELLDLVKINAELLAALQSLAEVSPPAMTPKRIALMAKVSAAIAKATQS